MDGDNDNTDGMQFVIPMLGTNENKSFCHEIDIR